MVRADGTRALIEVPLLHRQLPAEAVPAGIAAVLKAGSVSPQQVATEARNALADDVNPAAVSIAGEVDTTSEPDAEPAEPASGGAQVITLRPRSRPPVDLRPPPSVDAYDRLLTLPWKGASA